MNNQKTLIKNLFARNQGDRLLFIPIVCSYAARLAQISVREMLTSPTYLANAIHNAQRLIGYDGVINIYFLSGRQDKITSYIELASEYGIVIGYGFPQEILTKPTQEFRQYLEKLLPELKEGPFFLTTEGDVSEETPVENMHMVMRQITS